MTPSTMSTIIQRACLEIAGFDALRHRLERNMMIHGKCVSTLNNYLRSLALLALHYRTIPTALNQEQVEDYLFEMKKRTAAESSFKHALYGLRFLYRAEGLEPLALKLPSIKTKKTLPVVLNASEIRELLAAPLLLKHKLIVSVLYGCGLRCREVRRLQLQDIDFDRNVIHIRQSKGGKDRYVPIGLHLSRELKNYVLLEKPVKWLFNGKRSGPYSPQGIQRAVREAATKTSIAKRVTPHTLRHTYATHLLEQGLDIVTIKELLGHAHILTTMVYLHVTFKENKAVFSPLDTLLNQQEQTNSTVALPEVAPSEKLYWKNILLKRAENRQRRITQTNLQIELPFVQASGL